MIRRFVIALILGLGAAASLVGVGSLRAGQQSAPPRRMLVPATAGR